MIFFNCNCRVYLYCTLLPILGLCLHVFLCGGAFIALIGFFFHYCLVPGYIRYVNYYTIMLSTLYLIQPKTILNKFFFLIWVFFHDHLRITGDFFNSSLPLPPASQTLRRAITAESSPLHIANSQT